MNTVNLLKVLASLIFISLLSVNIVSAKGLAVSPSLIKTISQFYPSYNAEKECWITPSENVEENHYCLKIIQNKIINTKHGKRNYLVLSSTLLDKKGDDFISHVTQGMAALFILQNTGSTLIAAKSKILLGSYSQPPEQWDLIKLAPSDYWGWKTQVSDAHGGYFGGQNLIFAPYGKQGIKNIATIMAFFSNEGAGVAKKNLTNLDTRLITLKDSSKRIYSLKLSISGIKEGKTIKKRSWILKFDTKKWRYLAPEKWDLSGVEY